MRETMIGTHDVVLYDNIEEMPITRWHKYQKYAIIEGGIGGDLTTVDAHISRVSAFIRKGDKEKAYTELENLRQSIFFVQNEVNPQFLSCACLIAEIDGKPRNDLSEDGLKATIDILADVPTNIFTALIEVVKKKMEAEVAAFFPTIQGASSREKEYYDLMRKHTLLVLQGIQSDKQDKEQLSKVTDDLITTYAPTNFNGANNFEIDFDKQFERMCIVLAQNTGINPKQCSVMEFYNAYEVFKEQSKKAKHGRHQ